MAQFFKLFLALALTWSFLAFAELSESTQQSILTEVNREIQTKQWYGYEISVKKMTAVESAWVFFISIKDPQIGSVIEELLVTKTFELPVNAKLTQQILQRIELRLDSKILPTTPQYATFKAELEAHLKKQFPQFQISVESIQPSSKDPSLGLIFASEKIRSPIHLEMDLEESHIFPQMTSDFIEMVDEFCTEKTLEISEYLAQLYDTELGDLNSEQKDLFKNHIDAYADESSEGPVFEYDFMTCDFKNQECKLSFTLFDQAGKPLAEKYQSTFTGITSPASMLEITPKTEDGYLRLHIRSDVFNQIKFPQ